MGLSTNWVSFLGFAYQGLFRALYWGPPIHGKLPCVYMYVYINICMYTRQAHPTAGVILTKAFEETTSSAG